MFQKRCASGVIFLVTSRFLANEMPLLLSFASLALYQRQLAFNYAGVWSRHSRTALASVTWV